MPGNWPMKYSIAVTERNTIGPDGLGPIIKETVTWDKPQLQDVLAKLHTQSVAEARTPDTLAMKRGVKEFVAYYAGTPNLLLLAEDFFRAHEGLLLPDLGDLAPVACHFGRQARPYVRAGLQSHHALNASVKWSGSTFVPVRASNFSNVYSTDPERGVKAEDVLAPAGDPVRFADVEGYRALIRASNHRSKLVPRVLSLACDRLPGAFEFTVGLTLFSEPWVEAITGFATADRPTGLMFLPQEIEVSRSA